MRVLLLSDYYPPAPGGLAAHVRSLARALVDAGDQVKVVTARGGPEEDATVEVVEAGVSVAGVRRTADTNAAHMPPPWRDRRLRSVVAETVSRWSPDVVHAHGWVAFSATDVVGDAPLVVTLHDYGLLCPMRSLFDGSGHCTVTAGLACVRCTGANQSLAKRSLLSGAIVGGRHRLVRATSAFLAVSSEVARAHRLVIPPPKVDVVHNFIAGAPAGPVGHPPAGPARVLFVGPDDPYKGAPVAYDVMHRLRLRPGLDRTVLDHVGGTADRKSQGEGTGVDGVVRWGRQAPPELALRFAAATLVVAPALWADPCPTVVLEAMAAGRPVVGFATGGLPELVGDTGVVIPLGEVDAMVDAVERLLGDADEANRLGAAARSRVERFTAAAVVPRIRAAYDRARRTSAATPASTSTPRRR